MSNKTFRLIQVERDKQQRLRKKDTDEEVEYVDNARNISVVLDSGDLANDFEAQGFESSTKKDKCAPNSKMFHRLAKYYANKKAMKLAMAALEDAQKFKVDANERDYTIVETEARLHLDTGNYLKALKCAEIVLWQPNFKQSSRSIFVKSQALFNLCDFEHALIMFHKGINNIFLTSCIQNCR